MRHIRGGPYGSETQGRNERWHQTLKNVRREFDQPAQIPVLLTQLEKYNQPGDLEPHVRAFIEQYTISRYHTSLDNHASTVVYLGRGQIMLLERDVIKPRTIAHCRLQHRAQAA